MTARAGSIIALAWLASPVVAQEPTCRYGSPRTGAETTEIAVGVTVSQCGADPEADRPCLVLRRGASPVTCDLSVGVPVRDVRGVALSSEAQELVVLYWEAEHGGTAFYAAEGVQVWSVSSARLLLSVSTRAAEGVWNIDDEEPTHVCDSSRRVLLDAHGAVVHRRRGAAQCLVSEPDRRWSGPLPAGRIELRWPRLPPALRDWAR